MRVLQTLGTTDGVGPRHFRYRRTGQGLQVSTFGEGGWAATTLITNTDWTTLLRNMDAAGDTVFGISQTENSHYQGPIVSDLLAQLPSLSQLDSGYVAAILVHEGSMRLHHGQLPRESFKAGHPHPFEARVYLRKSDQ